MSILYTAINEWLDPLVKPPIMQEQLYRYADASGDHNPIHLDEEAAHRVGLDGVILHGLLKAAFLGQLVTDWAGAKARLKTFEVSYRGLDYPARPYRCRGVVKRVDGREVELEVWGEDPEGKRTTIGTAKVEIAS